MIRVILLILAISSSAWAEDKTYGGAIATVVSVHDGDTITVDLTGEWPPIIGEKIGVRIKGIDTRELSAGGQAARDFVRELIKPGDKVYLSQIERDKYFRLVANVGFDCKDLDVEWPMCSDLASTLLIQKFAVPYEGGTKKSFPRDIK